MDTRMDSSAPRRTRTEGGMTLAEVVVAAAIALIGFLIALVLYQSARQLFKKGELASDQQQQVRLAYDRMVRDLRLAGYNWNESGENRPGEEQIEGAFAGAIVFRSDFDKEDATLSQDPESLIAGTTNKATVGNDEIVAYFLGKDSNGDGTLEGGGNLVFNADMNSSGSATSPLYGAVAPRDGTTETITIPNVALTQDSPPYNLYRVSFSNSKTSWGTAGFRSYQLLAENLKSLQFVYQNASGGAVTPPGGGETASEKETRAAIRRIQVEVVGLTSVADPNYTDPNDATSTSHYRKFDLVTDVTPRNLGLKGRADTDLTPPSTPTGLALCPGHCGGMVVKWNANASNEGVTQYTVKWGLSSGNLPERRSTATTFMYIAGLTTGTTYYFAVAAEDAAGNRSNYSSEVSAQVRDDTNPYHTVPAAVDTLSFAGTGHSGGPSPLNGRIALSWAGVAANTAALSCDPSGNVLRDLAGYRLYKDTSASFTPSSGNRIADETTLGPSVLTYDDANVINCRSYYYHLRAVDLTACSNESAAWASSYQAQAYTEIAPAAPTGVVSLRTGITQATVSWTAVTRDSATDPPGGNPIVIDTYKVWRKQLNNGEDPESPSITWDYVGTANTLNYADSSCPADTGGKRVWYKVSALDDCINESAKSTAGDTQCIFDGTVSIVPPSSPPELDPTPRTVTVSAVGADTYVSCHLTISKTGGTVDLDQTQVATGHNWNFSWTPGQGAGEYVAVAVVSNAAGCLGTTTNTWQVVVLACATCITVPANNPDPSVGGSKYYRQQNAINNSCAYPIEVTRVVLREKSPTQCTSGCASPMWLQKIQYNASGGFANETTNVVYTAVSPGDAVSTTQAATIDFSASPLVVNASATTARLRFVFSTTTPVWEGTQSAKKHILLGTFSFQQISNLCAPSTLDSQQLD